MNRIVCLEGLRGYLALWVLIDHVMVFSAYESAALEGVSKVLRSGWLAVDVFIILSGFVIFFLLDTRKQSYLNFLVERFFRLWPVFIFLFVVSLPLLYVYESNVNVFYQFFSELPGADTKLAQIKQWRDSYPVHIALHITLLHGLIPESLLSGAPVAFLPPGWSISLEWQFYLVAPLLFLLVKGARLRLILFGVFIVIMMSQRQYFPPVKHGAFLPFHIEFFVLGMASYFCYKSFREKLHPLFFVLIVLACGIVYIATGEFRLIPVLIWVCVLALIIADKKQTFPLRQIMLLFENRLSSTLGRISYSIYLSHWLVIICVQWVILRHFQGLNQLQHFCLLLLASILGTIFVSVFLYRYIELPGIGLGKRLSEKLRE